MNKAAKKIYRAFEEMLGEYNAGLIVAIICDLLQECCGDRESFNMRSIEIKVNDYFTARHDFDEEE